MLKRGSIETVTVIRETDIGYMVGNDTEEVFLHKNEVMGEIAEGDSISVFLYYDHQGRVAATMKTPYVTTEAYSFAKVVKVIPRTGVFVDIGVSKDILVPEDELPGFKGVWPKEGDELYCRLKATHTDRLIAVVATPEIFNEASVSATPSMLNKSVSGRVFRTMHVGSNVFTDEHFIGFIHQSQRKDEPRFGERITGRIIDVKEDGTVNISLLPRKQEGIEADSEFIYLYMEGRGGAMPFWDKSLPEDIQERFGMSKAAFKRALGKLMKDEKVYQEEGWTYFKK